MREVAMTEFMTFKRKSRLKLTLHILAGKTGGRIGPSDSLHAVAYPTGYSGNGASP